ncbi:MAG: hypothetical protein ACREPR_08240, partial [Brasilonema sp.]
IVFRALQGFTGGVLIPTAMTVVLTTLPPSKQAIGLAAFYILPLYLAQIQGYNALQIGEVLIWAGIPQLFIIPLIPKLNLGKYSLKFTKKMLYYYRVF